VLGAGVVSLDELAGVDGRLADQGQSETVPMAPPAGHRRHRAENSSIRHDLILHQ
jgi:hypothetical protein